MLEFRILGPLEVLEGQRVLALGGPRQRALLALLLLHRGAAVPSDRLIDQLWDQRPPATAAKTLQGYVSHLRKALGSEVLLTRGGGYELVVAPEQVDADVFTTVAAAGRRALDDGDAGAAREQLGEALELWRGEPLDDLAYESFAQAEIARLQEARLSATEDRADADLMLGRHRELVGELETLAGRHPHRERLLGQLMLALYRSGRQADALEAYRRGRGVLDEELGLEPGPQLRALEQQILTHDPALDVAPAARSGPRPSIAQPTRRRGRTLIIAGAGLLLAAAVALGVTEFAGGSRDGLRPAPNSVAAIDTQSNRVVAQVTVGARPGAIAVASGSLWVANQDDQTISRVDVRSLSTERNLTLHDQPTGIATAGGGIWVSGFSPDTTSVSVVRIDPQFDALDRTVRIANVAAGTPAAIAARADALWVAPFAGQLTRLAPRSGRVLRRLDPGGAPAGLAVGPDAIWMTDTDADNVTRIDPTGLATSIAVGHYPTGIAIGYGGVWVADYADDDVRRIDPGTEAVTTTIPVGSAPTGVATGGGGVWVANSGDGTVTRIDPRTAKPVATIRVGGSPQQIAVARGRAWVTVDARTVPGAQAAASGGTVRIDAPSDVTSMDPALSYDNESAQLLQATCAKLLNYPDRSGAAGSELIPEVAQSLPSVSADGRSYSFVIRRGFRFSPPSDQAVTAQTFKDSIERTLSPQMKSPVASEYRDIAGAAAYMAGRASHISGVVVRGNTLTIRLIAPAPDLPARTAQPALCAVPSDTPIDPRGVRVIPSAGPYRVASYTPGQGIVLTRNPNYHGARPHRPQRIVMTVGVSSRRAVAQVQAGTADYALEGEVGRADGPRLAARYGAGSRAARHGRQRYFAEPEAQLDFLALNSQRPLFASRRMRQAVNYAIDRSALARLGDEFDPLPEHVTEDYLPPGIAGYGDVRGYPLRPDLRRARALVGGRRGATAVLWTCDYTPCPQQAQIIKTDLAAIGIGLVTKAFPDQTLDAKVARAHAPFDIAWQGWLPDYLDPDAMLNALLSGGTVLPAFQDVGARAQLAAAARLGGTKRYLAYGRVDSELVRDAAPFVAFGNGSTHELFSARMGCQVYGVYGADLANLCVRNGAR
jgi:YVTN family beta-propeller protein